MNRNANYQTVMVLDAMRLWRAYPEYSDHESVTKDGTLFMMWIYENFHAESMEINPYLNQPVRFITFGNTLQRMAQQRT